MTPERSGSAWTFDRIAAVGLVLTLALLYAVWRHDRDTTYPVLDEHDSAVAERPHVDSVIAEHADSARARIRIVYVGQDAAARLRALAALATARADSLAAVATTITELRVAYDSLHHGYDSLAVALTTEQQATTDALATVGFWQLAYTADSAARRTAELDADQLAARVRQLSRRRLWDYVAIGCGAGVRGADCILGIRVPLGR